MNLGSKLFPPPPLPFPPVWSTPLDLATLAANANCESYQSRGGNTIKRLIRSSQTRHKNGRGKLYISLPRGREAPIGRPAALARRHACARKKLVQLTTSSMHILRANSQESRHNAPLGRLPTRWCLASVITGLYESVLRGARPRCSQLSTPYSYIQT